jgi:SUMO ligase MMS21 Smc5/6 complex component
MHNDNYAIHKINKHLCIGNRLRRYRKQTGNINLSKVTAAFINEKVFIYEMDLFVSKLYPYTVTKSPDANCRNEIKVK